jgi:presqualene diphosphate synthase
MAVNSGQTRATGATAAPVATRSSFYTALRILPAVQRDAMFQVYDFCRAIDDIADAGGPRPQRLAELARWRADINNLYSGRERAPRVAGLAGPVAHFALAQADFDAILDGMTMDAKDDICAPDWATLDLYCDRVASAVGRLSVRIFGVPPQQGKPLAHHLGRALQLTNILRDLDEDAGLGRLYLPREALDGAGVTQMVPAQAISDSKIAAACAPVVARARGHFATAAHVMRSCPRATTRSPRLMASVYRGVLDDLVAQGLTPPRKRVRVAKMRVMLAVLRHGFF